jgi:hypothetical protein
LVCAFGGQLLAPDSCILTLAPDLQVSRTSVRRPGKSACSFSSYASLFKAIQDCSSFAPNNILEKIGVLPRADIIKPSKTVSD